MYSVRDINLAGIPHSSQGGILEYEKKSEQTHSFTNFPDPQESDEEDKSTVWQCLSEIMNMIPSV